MEHIISSTPGEIDYWRYHHYVESIRNRLPSHVYAFASNFDHFGLESHSSLHDAWLEKLTVDEIAEGERQETRRLGIRLSLLGPFYDRRIHLHDTGVTRYCFDTPPRYGNPRFTGHGDLFTHEIRLGQNGLLVHELMFMRDAIFLIESADIRHSEELIAKPNKM